MAAPRQAAPAPDPEQAATPAPTPPATAPAGEAPAAAQPPDAAPSAFEQAAPAIPDRPSQLAVTDATATQRVREHEIGGKTYRFTPGQATAMPFDHAMQLVNIPSFTVVGPNGEIYQPARTSLVPGTEDLRLRNDQVVATLYELMIGALRDRAVRWSSHPDYDARMGREELIQFLMERLGEDPPEAERPRKPGRSARQELYDDEGMPRGDGEVGAVTQHDIQQALAREAAARAGNPGLTGYGFRG